MASTDGDGDPVTPAGRLFLRPELDTIIHCIIGLQDSLDVEQAKSIVKTSLMVKHPRFTSLLVKDHNGIERWRKTDIDIDRHVISADRILPRNDDVNTTVNDYVADLSVSSPLSLDKPLWEVHVLTACNCVVLRLHHALGDGVSLMSMFLNSCRKAGKEDEVPSMGGGGERKQRRRTWREVLIGLVKMIVFSLVFCVEFLLRLLVSDRKTVVSGGDGVELWPRKLSTARFSLEDMKTVKKSVPGSTINDVLFGVVSSGLSKYLDHRTPKALPNGLRLTGSAMINLREQPGSQDFEELMKSKSGTRWGNKFGMLLLPVYYHKTGGGGDPLDYVKRAKVMIDRKKQSLEGHFSYQIGDFVMSWFGSKVACMLNYRIMCNTSFTISNVIGPQEEITIAGIPITYLRATTTSLPHALTMHMVSYAGRAEMQILVAKDIIPDPEFLAGCFQDALFEMKEAATSSI